MLSTASSVLRERASELAEKIVRRQFENQAGIWNSSEAAVHAKSLRDTVYHLTYLADAMDADDVQLFREYVAWVKVLFANLRFSDDVLNETLACTIHVLRSELPENERLTAERFLLAAVDEVKHAPTSLSSFLVGDDPLDQLAREYLSALLRADRYSASTMILDAVQKGMPVQSIYLDVFQRTQREIGRLWQTNQISVAQEHFCTAATQMVMSQLYPYIFTNERKDRRVVVACVGGELHEIGARMVADLFELNHWDSHFLGANTPPESILQTAVDQRADVLALSATITSNLSKVARIIEDVRGSNAKSLRVMVGGYPFNLSPDLWRKMGADGYAANAEDAILEANRILAN